MTTIKTERLRLLWEWVDPGTACVADVGTDHGLLPIALVEQGRAERAIGCDLRPAPLDGARARLAQAPEWVQRAVSLRLGDGLAPIERGEAQVAIMAGMGAATIREILQARDPLRDLGLDQLILQTPAGGMALRRALVEQGWHIDRERLLCDGRPSRPKYYMCYRVDLRVEEPSAPTPAPWCVSEAMWRQQDEALFGYLRQCAHRAGLAYRGACYASQHDALRVADAAARLAWVQGALGWRNRAWL